MAFFPPLPPTLLTPYLLTSLECVILFVLTSLVQFQSDL